MKNFNKPAALGLMVAAIGGAPEGAQADTAPLSATEQQFEACNKGVRASRDFIRSNTGFSPATISTVDNKIPAARLAVRRRILGNDRARLDLRGEQTGDIDRPDGSECAGNGSLEAVPVIKDDRDHLFTRVLNWARVKISFNNEMLDEGQPAHDEFNGTVSFRKACEATASDARLVLRLTEGYSEGYSDPYVTEGTAIAVNEGRAVYHDELPLPCAENPHAGAQQ